MELSINLWIYSCELYENFGIFENNLRTEIKYESKNIVT